MNCELRDKKGKEMFWVYFLFYALMVALIIFDVFLAFKLFEYGYCAHIRHQPPLVSSGNYERRYVIEQIKMKYPDAKNICEIGSGFGGLARAVAHNTKAKVYALENMPFSAFISKMLDKLSLCKNNTTIWCDAFKYMDDTNIKFDVAIAYLGPAVTQKIKKYKNKIDVLISLDFEIEGIKPKCIIDLGHGYTIYNRVKYPHKLFIYEFK